MKSRVDFVCLLAMNPKRYCQLVDKIFYLQIRTINHGAGHLANWLLINCGLINHHSIPKTRLTPQPSLLIHIIHPYLQSFSTYSSTLCLSCSLSAYYINPTMYFPTHSNNSFRFQLYFVAKTDLTMWSTLALMTLSLLVQGFNTWR